MSDYDDEMEHVFREVTQGSDFKSDQGSHPECDPSEDVPLQPLCRQCVRDLPARSGELCEFCQLVGEVDL